jgi:clan AA aspartic protease (TIGR02281 family)
MNTLNRLLIIFIVTGFFLSLHGQVAYYGCLNSYQNRDYREAIICLSEYIDKNPKDVDALSIRAKCYKYIDDYPMAFSDINNAIKYYNRNAITYKESLYTQRGRFYADIENYDEALKDFAIAFKINSKNTDVLFERANLYYTLEDYNASDADWKQILKIEKNNVNASVGLARNMIAKNQLDNAIKELDRLEKMDRENYLIYEYRTEAYAKKGDYRKAIDDMIDWCYYDEIDRYKQYVLSEYGEHEFTYAVAKVSEKIVKKKDDETNWHWLLLRTALYEDHEMYKEAIEDYNQVEKLLSSPELYIYLRRGECYAELGEYDNAIADFNKGLELQEYKDLYLYKASAERSKGNYDTSIADYTKVIELDPMNDFAYYARGWTKNLKKDFQGALKDYTTSIEIDKDFAYSYMARGRLYQRELNQPELAKKDFETTLSLDNEIKKGGNCRQYVLFHLGRIDEAIAYQDSILSKYPTTGNYYDAACLYSLMNRPSDAITYLRTALEKGYRDFIHIEYDTDLDNIRNMPEFIELCKEWKNKAEKIATETSQTIQEVETKKYIVKMKPLKSGVYEISCTVNDLPLKFIFDTGASNITISSLDAAFMLKNNYLNEYDFKNKKNYRTASGDIVEGTIIRLRNIKIGELELNNIEASVVHKQNAPLLFGQSALGKFVKITIDNANNEITFESQYQK